MFLQQASSSRIVASLLLLRIPRHKCRKDALFVVMLMEESTSKPADPPRIKNTSQCAAHPIACTLHGRDEDGGSCHHGFMLPNLALMTPSQADSLCGLLMLSHGADCNYGFLLTG